MTPRRKADQLTYENFDLRITANGDAYEARVLNSPVGEAATTFALPFTETELRRFAWLTQRTLRGVRLLSSSTNADDTVAPLTPQAFGTRLYNALFAGEIGSGLLRSLDAVERVHKGLRIRLRFDQGVAALADLPWEYLYASPLARPLALSGQTVIARYLEVPQAQPPLQVEPPLCILALIANPSDAPPLQVDQEWQRLQAALQPLIEAGLVTLERLPVATLDALQDRLRGADIHILHYIGHGYFDEAANRGGLLLEDGTGRGLMVEADRLATLFHDHKALRLVLLNACEGARADRHDFFSGTAQTLVRQDIPAVVAMQFKISDKAALTLAREFYEAVADNYPVDAALAEARKAIYLDGNDHEWATPVLFSRSADNRILEIPQSPSAIHKAPIPFHVPFLHNDKFVGRDADLVRLHALLVPSERNRVFLKNSVSDHSPTPVGIRPAGLTGQGGIGKTQLAVAYAYACGDGIGSRDGYRGSYPGGIFWLNAAEPWPVEFARLGVVLDPAAADLNQQQQIRIVQGYLREHPDSLLILDNVADPRSSTVR